jgi:hypothetical protein
MNLPNLPLELINKILIMRPSHPLVKIVQPLINNYMCSDDNGEYYYEFYYYTLNEIFDKTIERKILLITKQCETRCNEEKELEPFLNKYFSSYIEEFKEKRKKMWFNRSREFRIKEGLASWAP